MRVAIFSDVHGNLSGMEAVLADMEGQSPDLVVFAGDLYLFGPRPAECWRLLRERCIPAVIGNTDAWLAGAGGAPEKHQASMAWTLPRFTAEELGALGRLPFSLRVSPTARAADDLLIVHANPRNVDDIIFPAEADQIAIWKYVRQPDAELAPLLDGVEAAVMAYGHLHIPGIRQWGGLTLVNVASVNMPGDKDGRAKYALLEWDGGHWSVDHRRVAYDTAAESAAFQTHRPPRWEEAVAALATDGYYYPQQI